MDVGGPTDLPTKYQKLATEYSKVRAQVSVLKKAVFEEQSKVVDLKDSLKERDHVIRKNEQEMESLHFRNQQLARRVTVLQEELDSWQQKPRGKNKKGASEPITSQPFLTSNILGEELQLKITENASLHQQIYDANLEHQQTVDELQHRLDELEKQLSSHNQAVDEMNLKNHNLTEKLQQDKTRLEARLQSVEKDLKDANFRADMFQGQLQRVQIDLGFKLDSSTKIIKSRLPFLDNSNYTNSQNSFYETMKLLCSNMPGLVLEIPILNSLNVPPYNRLLEEISCNLVQEVGNILCDILARLSNFHTYSEQRALLSPVDESTYVVSPVNNQLARYLHENATYLRQLEQSFKEFQSGVQELAVVPLGMTDGFEQFLNKLQCYVLYLKKLMPYHLLSLEEENSLLSCPPSLKSKNAALCTSWGQMLAAFDKVATYSKLLTAGASLSAKQRALKGISMGVSDLHKAVKEMCAHYNSKLVLERELPTASEKLKTTDECILTSLVGLVQGFGKLSSLLSQKLEPLLNESKSSANATFVATKNNPKLVAKYRRRAVDYIASLDEEEPDSVPHAEALKNRYILQNSTESRESLASQLNSLQEKIGKLEQSKEHWMLEYQLLHMKHGKLQKRAEEYEKSSRNGSEGTPTPTRDQFGVSESLSQLLTSPSCITTLLGKLELREADAGDSQSNSNELRKYFVERINDLVVQRQLADSKAVTFHAELCALQKRLVLAENSKASLQDQLSKSTENILNLKEELHTTTNGYKAQLSTMSEHLANMNDKLTSQKDEIDELKFMLSSAGNKRTKGK